MISTRFIRLLFVALITLFGPVALFADGGDADKDRDYAKIGAIAAQFVPPSMAETTAGSPNEFPMRQAYTTGQLDKTGTSYIVAAYANGLDGRVRLLSPQPGGGYAVAGEADSEGMAGENTRLQLIDVDGDGFLDVVVSFSGERGPSAQWIFKWTGSKFIDLTPLETVEGARTSALRSAVFTDIDGDGALEIVSAPQRGGSYSDGSTNPERDFQVFRMRNGTFADSGSLVFFSRYVGGRPPSEQTFSVNRTNITYTMTIINGDARGNHRVMKGNVMLNGIIVATAADLKSQPLSLTVHLGQSNQVAVTIDGLRDQTLLVTIRPDVRYVTQPVAPKLQCVWFDGSGRFTASFGYENPNPSQIIVEIGDDNFFADRANRGQPAAFLPGMHDGAFWAQSNGETLTWTLNGTTVSATAGLSACADPEPVSRTSNAGVTTE